MLVTTTSTALFAAATIVWLAMMAGLLPAQIGWFAATTLYLLSMLAPWLPTRRPRRRDQKGRG